eukprot:357123-Chlamydomonas_euryale.AAC.3
MALRFVWEYSRGEERRRPRTALHCSTHSLPRARAAPDGLSRPLVASLHSVSRFLSVPYCTSLRQTASVARHGARRDEAMARRWRGQPPCPVGSNLSRTRLPSAARHVRDRRERCHGTSRLSGGRAREGTGAHGWARRDGETHVSARSFACRGTTSWKPGDRQVRRHGATGAGGGCVVSRRAAARLSAAVQSIEGTARGMRRSHKVGVCSRRQADALEDRRRHGGRRTAQFAT